MASNPNQKHRDSLDPYLRTVFARETESVANASRGWRTRRLNQAGTRFGQFVGGGEASLDVAVAALMWACEANLLVQDYGQARVLALIESAIARGAKRPAKSPYKGRVND